MILHSNLDYLIVLLYLIFIFILAYLAGRKTKLFKTGGSTQEMVSTQYMANKSLTFTESICSIIATEVSALTFLGIPAIAFNRDFSFIQIYLGAIAGRLIIAKYFLPKVYDQGLTIYEVMAKETGLPSGQRAVSLFYLISKILSVGVRLFSGSIMIAHFFSLNIILAVSLITFLTFLYTQIGGLKAVVRTDIFQLILFASGGIIAHILIPNVAQADWSQMISMAWDNNKMSFLNFSDPLPFIIGVMGGFLFDMATHGVDQDFVQRLTANKRLKDAQRAIFLSSFVSISVGFLFLSIGSLLWSFYQSHPMPSNIENADHLFANFIVNYFPAGIKGLMVAGVIAATMSTLDSTINALCSCLYNDILTKRKTTQIKSKAFFDSVLITLAILIIAIFASKNDELLYLGLKIQSWTAGPLLALFFSKIIFKRHFNFKLTTFTVSVSYLIGISGVVINTYILNWNWNLNTYWGCVFSLVFLKLYSTLKVKN